MLLPFALNFKIPFSTDNCVLRKFHKCTSLSSRSSHQEYYYQVPEQICSAIRSSKRVLLFVKIFSCENDDLFWREQRLRVSSIAGHENKLHCPWECLESSKNTKEGNVLE
ncbi:hypothetical protein AVEN_200001-1 [Araneus ventricosus]|uniref:Uncharacterized protein n=1 Tax=Araneus ventricosus TaxID=182803 RepID=A0A4Y2BX46_ARAVE|nr:hypothetical protein AVEN_200001-1 [Araneus ventricosus]